MPQNIIISPISRNPHATYTLIYFITGNPGLISYYSTFLKALHQRLSKTQSTASHCIHVYGRNLAGFEDNDGRNIGLANQSYFSTPYGLEDQIHVILSSLQERKIETGPRAGQSYDKIVVMGHSVGCYILLEVLQRLRNSSHSLLNIKAGILLFPTVTHIAKSSNGTKFGLLFRIPNFARVASSIAKFFITLTPTAILKRLVSFVTRMPIDAAEITTNFLQSKMGIWQTLHLAKDEMDTITEDKWDEDIWGIEHEDSELGDQIPRLFFYFARNDHWVASHTRDELISARAQNSTETESLKPVMLIDTNGIGHAFCINDSEIIAEKASVWISEILETTK